MATEKQHGNKEWWGLRQKKKWDQKYDDTKRTEMNKMEEKEGKKQKEDKKNKS